MPPAIASRAGAELDPEMWRRLRYHPEQHRLWNSKKRFCVVEATRRGGKTELAMRRGVIAAMDNTEHQDFLVVFAAPTRDHGRAIYWDRLKSLVPRAIVWMVSESHLEIRLVNGATIAVIGMDKPQRLEGRPIDWGFFDEFWNYRGGVWAKNIRPALSTRGREGSAWIMSVPRPSLQLKELADHAQKPDDPEWDYFNWDAYGILDPKEIESARATLDPLSFAQEFEAKRVSVAGRAYYTFERKVHATERMEYRVKEKDGRELGLDFCFDFNRSPGVAVVCQDQLYLGKTHGPSGARIVDDTISAYVGEVWIPYDSNTPAVCRKLIADWGHHKSNVYLYGDATGGAKGTSSVAGSDWDIITTMMKAHFGPRVKSRVQKSNPSERARVNSMNARFRTADGVVHCMIDPLRCPHLANDVECVTVKQGTDGELDKDADEMLTHPSDAGSYREHEKHPLHRDLVVSIGGLV